MGHDISHYAREEDFAPPRASGAGIFGELVGDDADSAAPKSSPNLHKMPLFDSEPSRDFSGEGDAFSMNDLDDFDPFGAVPDSGFDLNRGETRVQTITSRIEETSQADEPFAPQSTIVVDPSLNDAPATQAQDSNAGLSSELFQDLPPNDAVGSASIDVAASALNALPEAPSLPLEALSALPQGALSDLPEAPDSGRPRMRPAMQVQTPAAPVDIHEETTGPFGADTEVDGFDRAANVHDENTSKNQSALGESSEEESPFERDFESPLIPEAPVVSTPQAPGDLLPTHSGELRPGAVLLSALEAQMDGATPLDLSAGDSFDALEQAFEDAEHQESARSALLAVSEDLGMSSANIPMRAEDVASSIPAPPASVPRRRAVDMPHLSLSKDTLALAGLPMPRGANINAAHALTREDVNLPSSALSPLPDETSSDSPYVAPPFAAAGAELDRNTDPALSVEVHRIEPTYSGFTPLRVALGVLSFLLLGLLLGALLAPGKEVDDTPRGLATALLAEGNEAFSEGSTEVALEKYRNAIVKDQSFVAAYRAKAIALAKSEGREVEAVAAYEKYLKVAGSDAADASEIKEIIARYKGTTP